MVSFFKKYTVLIAAIGILSLFPACLSSSGHQSNGEGYTGRKSLLGQTVFVMGSQPKGVICDLETGEKILSYAAKIDFTKENQIIIAGNKCTTEGTNNLGAFNESLVPVGFDAATVNPDLQTLLDCHGTNAADGIKVDLLFKGKPDGTGSTMIVKTYDADGAVLTTAPLSLQSTENFINRSTETQEMTLQLGLGNESNLVALACKMPAYPLPTIPTSAVSLKESLTSFWGLNESTDGRLDMMGANTLLSQNGVGVDAGIVDASSLFDGVLSQFLLNLAPQNLGFTNHDVTVSGWVKFDSYPAHNSGLWGKGNSGNSTFTQQEYFAYHDVNAGITFGVSDGSQSCVLGTYVTPPIGEWTFIVSRYEASTQKLVIQINNGLLKETLCTVGPTDRGNSFTIGRSYNAFLSGKIDSLGIWSRPLTSSEQAHLYNAGAGREYPFE